MGPNAPTSPFSHRRAHADVGTVNGAGTSGARPSQPAHAPRPGAVSGPATVGSCWATGAGSSGPEDQAAQDDAAATLLGMRDESPSGQPAAAAAAALCPKKVAAAWSTPSPEDRGGDSLVRSRTPPTARPARRRPGQRARLALSPPRRTAPSPPQAWHSKRKRSAAEGRPAPAQQHHSSPAGNAEAPPAAARVRVATREEEAQETQSGGSQSGHTARATSPSRRSARRPPALDEDAGAGMAGMVMEAGEAGVDARAPARVAVLDGGDAIMEAGEDGSDMGE